MDLSMDLSKRALEIVEDGSAKKAKVADDRTYQHLSSFQDFVPRRVLSEDSRTKFMSVEGTFGASAETAVVVIEKTPFSKDTYQSVFTGGTKLEETFHNDIYTSYGGKLDSAGNGKHFRKTRIIDVVYRVGVVHFLILDRKKIS